MDASGTTWDLNYAGGPVSLDWEMMPIQSSEILAATVKYIADLVRTKSAKTVHLTFGILLKLGNSASFSKADRDRMEIPAEFFSELWQYVGRDVWEMHYFRHWYRSCVDRGCEAFSAEVAFELDEKRIPGRLKGQAVLSLDPETGPLNDLEITGLLNALRAAHNRKTLLLDEQAALWLCIALGPNPFQAALLREQDVEILTEGGQSFIQIRVPRTKKPHQLPRTEFKTRKLTMEIGQRILELIEQNRHYREVHGWPNEAYEFPLFVRRTPRPDQSTGPMAQYAMHLYTDDFTLLVERAARRLGVISPRTQKLLHVTTRRLRYTFATRLVREGASAQELAEALDHTDLQNVHVYFDIKSDIVESLDRATALALGPIAQAFLGKIVGSEAGAVRGDDPRSRIMSFDKRTEEAEGLGTCGEYSFCGLFAPLACYTCVQFQPWMDGPHDKILHYLLVRRDRKLAAGCDGRMVAIHDATILAIGDVIARIEAIHGTELA
nr:site-specific integrase [Microvirga tunisiensis]